SISMSPRGDCRCAAINAESRRSAEWGGHYGSAQEEQLQQRLRELQGLFVDAMSGVHRQRESNRRWVITKVSDGDDRSTQRARSAMRGSACGDTQLHGNGKAFAHDAAGCNGPHQ